MQCCSGIAPVTEASGNSQWVHVRFACPKFLRQTFHEFASSSIQYSEWARAYYEHQRNEKHHSHHAAVRSLAFTWQRIIYRCWKDGKAYDEEIYMRSLRRRGSLLGLGPNTGAGWAVGRWFPKILRRKHLTDYLRRLRCSSESIGRARPGIFRGNTAPPATRLKCAGALGAYESLKFGWTPLGFCRRSKAGNNSRRAQ